eukprot:GILI01007973.1.p1 GENE.GILI01007973.1~~GILI01007973.1.p1  ORF type:complete len:356 (+),score=101.40 GILI01007973.1:82-1068(+)
MLNKLKALDVYRKVPSDLTEPTISGAAVSVLSGTFIVILFFSELFAYLSVQTQSEMFIDVNRGGEKLRINIDVTLHRLPCSIVGLDAQDIMGSHEVDVSGSMVKRRLTPSGSVIGEENALGGSHSEVDLDRVRKEVEDKEGCQMVGYIFVNKVPGNFHISTHSQSHILNRVFSSLESVDVSHSVNHISFGDDHDLKKIKKTFDQGVLNPLDGVQKLRPPQVRAPVTYEYYVKVVPTTYVPLSGNELYVHQFTANSNEVQGHHLPAIYFRYDLSPVTVKFTQKKESFFHFLVQVCAIIGGVFTVAGIIDSVIHRSVVALIKKAQVGKLS